MKETKKSGLGTAGLVLGIIGICTSFIPIINNLSFVMGILAVILGIIALAKKAGKGKTITAIILGVLAIVITINSQKALSESLNEAVSTFNNSMNEISGGKTEEILGKDVEVILGEFEVEENDYWAKTKMVVKVTNKTSERKSFNIQIEAINESGDRITQDYVYANDLGAGQSQNFDIFTLVTSDKLEMMKNATYKIVEVLMY